MAWQINNREDKNENSYRQIEEEQDEDYCSEHRQRS